MASTSEPHFSWPSFMFKSLSYLHVKQTPIYVLFKMFFICVVHLTLTLFLQWNWRLDQRRVESGDFSLGLYLVKNIMEKSRLHWWIWS